MLTTASPLTCQVMNKAMKARQKLNVHPHLLVRAIGRSPDSKTIFVRNECMDLEKG